MQLETKFKKRFLPLLRKIPKTWFVKTQFLSLGGIPDILGCVAGRFVAIELKKDALEVPTKLQQHVLDLIEKAGGHIFIAHPANAAEILTYLSLLE